MRAFVSLFLIAASSVVFSLPCAAQRTISTWISTVDSVGGGFLPGDAEVEVPLVIGETYSLYLWVRNNAEIPSITYDLAVETAGVIELTGVEVFNPDVIDGGSDIGDRWNLPLAPGAISGDGQEISAFGAVNVNTVGLAPGTKHLDVLYDPLADAALIARVDFHAIGLGNTTLVLDDTPPVVIIDPPYFSVRSFGAATIRVVVPEPSAVWLATAGALVATIRLRRRFRRD
jgi:hypothetical protein